MGKIEKNNIFIQNPNKKDRILVFQDRLKRHLSNEYLYIVDKKDDLESQLMQLKVEQSQQNKTLFPNIEQKDVRKYFSPLNLQEIEDDQKDEKDKQLMISIERLQDEVSQLDNSMHEIREFLHDIDNLLLEEEEVFGSSDLASVYEEKDRDDDPDEEKDSDKRVQDNIYQQNGDKYLKMVDYFDKNPEIYPQMLRNLYDFSDYIKEEFNQVEVLIEFNDNNIETSAEINRNLVAQLNYNVNQVMQDFDISTLLILGEVTAKKITLSLNYVCDLEEIEAMNVTYEVKYTD